MSDEENGAKESDRKISATVKVALITAITGIVVALIGIVPDLIKALRTTPEPPQAAQPGAPTPEQIAAIIAALKAIEEAGENQP